MASSTKEGMEIIRQEVVEKGERDLVMAYLEEVSKHPTLTDAEEMQLGREKEAGELAAWYREDWSKLSEADVKKRRETAKNGRLARKRLTEANLHLAVSIARRYQGQGLGVLALIEAGNRGLVRAIDKFDGTTMQRTRPTVDRPLEDHGLEESTLSNFAKPWIVAAIHRALDVAHHARIPRYGEAKNNADVQKLHDLLEELPRKLGREPTVDEVAKDLGFTPERARHYASTMVAMLDVDPNENDNERAERVLRVANGAGSTE